MPPDIDYVTPSQFEQILLSKMIAEPEVYYMKKFMKILKTGTFGCDFSFFSSSPPPSNVESSPVSGSIILI